MVTKEARRGVLMGPYPDWGPLLSALALPGGPVRIWKPLSPAPSLPGLECPHLSVVLEAHFFSRKCGERTSPRTIHRRRGPVSTSGVWALILRLLYWHRWAPPPSSQGPHSTPESQPLKTPNTPLPSVSKPAGTLVHHGSNLHNLPVLRHQELSPDT